MKHDRQFDLMGEHNLIHAAVEWRLQMRIRFAGCWNRNRGRVVWNRGRVGVLLIWLAVTAALAPAIHAAEEPLSMGVFPRRNSAETAKAFTPMADYLGERLGRKVNLITSKNFETFWKAVTERRYD